MTTPSAAGPQPNRNPRQLGYRWPAEWEPHAATWLSWPRNPQTWPGTFNCIPAAFAQLARTIAEYEPVHILAGGSDVMSTARSLVGDVANIVLHDIETNDAWMRDHGPTFLNGPKDSLPALVDWRYNAWGGKYPPFDKDDAVPARLAEITGRRRFETQWVLEGGAIEGNGAGTILTTESCLLDANRNPTATREAVERYLRDYCCAENILWLSGGSIAGDDTDGHIDQLARFVDPTTIVVAVENNQDDENYEPLQQNLRELSEVTDQSSQPLKLVPLPMPRAKFQDGQRLPASYANFYIVNGAVIVPQYEDPADRDAGDVLASLFPDRQIRALPALDIVWGLGAFHCLTQQEPR